MQRLKKQFVSVLEKSFNKGGWTYATWPESSKFFGTKGLVKIKGKINGYPFRASFMAMGNGKHMLPINMAIRKKIQKEAGQKVTIQLQERI